MSAPVDEVSARDGYLVAPTGRFLLREISGVEIEEKPLVDGAWGIVVFILGIIIAIFTGGVGLLPVMFIFAHKVVSVVVVVSSGKTVIKNWGGAIFNAKNRIAARNLADQIIAWKNEV